MKRITSLFVLVLALVHTGHASNVPVTVELNRLHSAVGAFGCTITGATVATPSVISCAAADNFIAGDQVQITGVGGTTTDNTLAYVLPITATTFSIWSDAATTVSPIAGVGTYTSGGKASIASDISQWSTGGDFTLVVTLSGASGGRVNVCVESSTDGFVNDVEVAACVDNSTPIYSGTSDVFSWRKYQIPSYPVGALNATTRVAVISLDESASVTVSAKIQ